MTISQSPLGPGQAHPGHAGRRSSRAFALRGVVARNGGKGKRDISRAAASCPRQLYHDSRAGNLPGGIEPILCANATLQCFDNLPADRQT